MPTGLSAAAADSVLAAVFGPSCWLQLHLGEPGAVGTAQPAAESRRLEAALAPAAAGTIESSHDLTWQSVAAAETYTHASYWRLETGGDYLGSDKLPGPVERRSVQAGDNFVIPAGEITVTLRPLSS